MTANPQESTPETLVALLERVAGEDASALRELYDVASPKLFGLALRILSKPEWAEEVLQDSFVNIWRFAGDYRRGLSAPMTWMSAIVRNRAFDQLRRVNATETEWNDMLDELVASGDPTPEELSSMSAEARQLARCMETLEPVQRQAVALAYLRDQSHSEIAEVLTVPLGTVKSWIRRGLQKLKTCLGGV
ncbi:sigma-70 family RNA polymerase sigma factor [Paraburkholderia sp. BL10I2N1]|uniref:RNA polymerase sigma factor n=1 Tax=Paraburkholderia sp. BL10I2N1 TaxID=1938796 RepID=UPI00105D7901|nr:sigma-70 family RNA polymerase sigma factor [Paraburkholderia sp. BL10I2N1]TDN63779.1 RNA polymerase ECF family sigma subunit [Paraburkholderia sp. BL10I2N1]